MAELVIKIEQGREDRTLNVLGYQFRTIMIENESGGMDGSATLLSLVEQKHSEWLREDGVRGAIDKLDELDFVDLDRARKLLEIINRLEY